MLTREQLIERYGLHDYPDLLFADGFDDCIIGILWDGPGETPRIAYSRAAMLEKIASQAQGENADEDAAEHFSYNIQGAYVGPHTPAYVELFEV